MIRNTRNLFVRTLINISILFRLENKRTEFDHILYMP